MQWILSPVIVVALVACDDGGAPAAAPPAPAVPIDVTPNQLLTAGAPTFVIGTLGDDRADRSMRAQAELVRSMFPGSSVVTDTSFDVAAGPSAWPGNPIVYGGDQVSGVIRGLPSLPVRVSANRIAVGETTFDGAGYRLVAAIPARAGDARSPGHPAFVLYAGTGMPGIVEINSIRHGTEPILIADAFGRLQTGRFYAEPNGELEARLDEAEVRVAWRRIERNVAGTSMTIAFLEAVGTVEDEARVIEAIVRGLTTSAAKLELSPPPPVSVYVHDSNRSKQSLTGDGGDGHAVVLASALHVILADPSPGGPLERLVAHEATHVLAGHAWGATSSPLLGEGLAVWASGGYAGEPLTGWSTLVAPPPPATTLLPVREFRARPAAETYPVAGLLMQAMIDQVGLAAVRDHLYGAPHDGWAEACTRAGTTAERIDSAVVPQPRPSR